MQNESVVLSTWEGSLSMLGGPVLASQEGKCLFFKWTFFEVSETFSSILTADLQRTLVGHKKTCSSYHKIQVISCVSLNDFHRPQYVTISFITMNRHNQLQKQTASRVMFYPQPWVRSSHGHSGHAQF